MRKARWWSSDMPMTPSRDSSIRRTQITSWKTYGSGWGSLGWNSIPTRRAGLGSVGFRKKTGNEEGKADRKRSTFWDSVCCRSTRIWRSHDLINSWTSCAIDEGGPLEIGFQEQVTNHLQAATVKSRGGERWRKSARKTCAGAHPRDERKETFRRRVVKKSRVVKTRCVKLAWDEPAGCLMIERVAAGVERA